jgi:hypothetical protein
LAIGAGGAELLLFELVEKGGVCSIACQSFRSGVMILAIRFLSE